MVVAHRLDQILGKQGSKGGKDVYDNKYCLASRIVNVERQVVVPLSHQVLLFFPLIRFFFLFHV